MTFVKRRGQWGRSPISRSTAKSGYVPIVPIPYSGLMKISIDRILTTHVGSLPRQQSVVELLFRKERQEPYDKGEFDQVIAAAVSRTVQRQVETGLDTVSDGETSKIGY